MRGRTLLSGTESLSIEIAGRLDPARARVLAGGEPAVREDDGGAEIEMLAFRMSGLAPDALPWAGMDYGEVLFRLGVEWDGAPAWLVVRCALDRAAVAGAAAALMRYPVTRVGRIEIEPGASRTSVKPFTDVREAAWRLSADDHRGGVLRATLVPQDEPAPPPAAVRPVLVRSRGKLLRVPWDETPAPRRMRALATVETGILEREALGSHASWSSAVLHEGRVHRCGLAGPPR